MRVWLVIYPAVTRPLRSFWFRCVDLRYLRSQLFGSLPFNVWLVYVYPHSYVVTVVTFGWFVTFALRYWFPLYRVGWFAFTVRWLRSYLLRSLVYLPYVYLLLIAPSLLPYHTTAHTRTLVGWLPVYLVTRYCVCVWFLPLLVDYLLFTFTLLVYLCILRSFAVSSLFTFTFVVYCWLIDWFVLFTFLPPLLLVYWLITVPVRWFIYLTLVFIWLPYVWFVGLLPFIYVRCCCCCLLVLVTFGFAVCTFTFGWFAFGYVPPLFTPTGSHLRYLARVYGLVRFLYLRLRLPRSPLRSRILVGYFNVPFGWLFVV